MTGLRQGELVALRWLDIDWGAGVVRVRRNYTRRTWGTPKSRRSNRAVPLADRVAGELERHFQRSAYQADDALVFCHPITFHSLRHTSGREWRRSAFRCARCRSGWATATSRPR
jgi:integrase